MTSREIAELTEREHKNVIRDIRTMLIELHGQDLIPEQYRNRHSEYIRQHSSEIADALFARFADGSKLSHYENQPFTFERDSRGYVSLISLDKDHTLTLLTGYDAKARFKVIRRWQELEAAAAKPSINDPIIAALVQGLVEIDALKQQQAALTRKTEQLESRVENVELQHRNGVPKGYLSRSQAQAAYGLGLSKEVFFLALRQLKVPTTSYIHHGEDGNDVATFAYLESDIADAVQAFLADSFQATPCMCESPLLNGKRFRYLKTSASDQALKKR
jgi:hypothetical protein